MGIKTRGGNLKVPLVNIATIKVGKTVIPPIEIGDIVGNRKPISEHAITVAEKTKLKSRPVGRKKLVARRPRRGKVEEYDECLIESINLIRRIKRMKKSETEKNETEVPKTIADKVLQVIVSMEKTEFDTNFLRQEVLKRYPDLQNSVKNNLINAPLNSIFNQLQKKGFSLLKKERKGKKYLYAVNEKLKEEFSGLSVTDLKGKNFIKAVSEGKEVEEKTAHKPKQSAVTFSGKISKLVIDLNRGLITIEVN